MLPITDAMRERWMDDRRELEAAQRESSEWNSVLNAGAPVNEWMIDDAPDEEEDDDDGCAYDARYDGWVCTDGRFIPSRTHPWTLIHREEDAD